MTMAGPSSRANGGQGEGPEDAALRAHVKEFLKTLSAADCRAVVAATTCKTVEARDLDHAVELILHFSDPVALLNRQKVTKNVLMNYIAQKKLRCPPSAKKGEMCSVVLRHWGAVQYGDLNFRDRDPPERKPNVKEEKEAKPNVPPPPAPPQHSSVGIQAGAVPEQVSSGMQTVPNTCREVTSFYTAPQEVDDEEDMEEDGGWAQTEEEKRTGLQLADQFSNWFYPRLNSLEDFLPDHFWKDCSLLILVDSGRDTRRVNINKDGHQVYRTLRSLVAEEGCHFLPNNINGTGLRGFLNPHGLGQVIVCGTVHRAMAGVGTFDWMFGLMRDPTFNNNFKVKFSILKYREQSMLMNAPNQRTDMTMVGRIEEVD